MKTSNLLRITAIAPVLAGSIAACATSADPSDGTESAAANAGPKKITIKTHPEGAPFGYTTNTTLVAFQDGNGAWKELTGTSGVYTATATGAQYAVATACLEKHSETYVTSRVAVYYLTTSDTSVVDDNGCTPTAQNVNVTATLKDIPAKQIAELRFGQTQIGASGPMPGFTTTPKGEPVDPILLSYDNSTGLIAGVPSLVYRAPAITAQADQTLQYDVSALGVPPESFGLKIDNLVAGEFPSAETRLSTRSTQPAQLIAQLNAKFAPLDHYYAVPLPAGLLPGDITLLNVVGDLPGNDAVGPVTFERSITLGMKTPGSAAVFLPAQLDTAQQPSLDPSPARRATITFPITPATLTTADYQAAITQVTSELDGSLANQELDVVLGAGRAAGQTSVTVTTPDLTGLADWSPRMAFSSNGETSWSMSRNDRNVARGAAPSDGMEILTSTVSGMLSSIDSK
ncbi:MAG TPA: hypothetical protein VH165_07615 [Kofleriaceae bacterium]|jgi:hypothetical protein|nr:hypothetical protein [Kofleriaceae bacterium]